VEFETSAILVKTIKIVPTKEYSNKSIDEIDVVTPATTQQQKSIATSKLKRVIKNLLSIITWWLIHFRWLMMESTAPIKKHVYAWSEKGLQTCN